MVTRIEVSSKIGDTRAQVRKKYLEDAGFSGKIKNLWLVDVYTIEKKFSQSELIEIALILSNPVTQKFHIRIQKGKHLFEKELYPSWAIEIGFLPGVTDNAASTVKEIIEDFLKLKFSDGEGVYTSQISVISGKLSKEEIITLANSLYNPLIQRVNIKNYQDFLRAGGMDFIVPKVSLLKKPQVKEVNLNIVDEELEKIGKKGIANPDGSRRGPLSLDLTYMKSIQKYFKKESRNPTDIELESLAQTWSEHCKHTIFADPIDEIKEGLFKTYIKNATENIRKRKGKKDRCISVFSDNSGAISFDDKYLITHKVETHNTPSALDPFGGSITGIVGVNRDTIGFGLGAKPIANSYGFCFANPRENIPLYRGPNFTQKMLSSRRIMEGVIAGVNSGGNQSGIPTPSGFVYFDQKYRGKPLVFVGTVGLIPQKIKNKKSYEKKAKPGDLIVIIGGKVGKDGIHGATFSSEALNEGSPASAVQIGDPITQKKLSDTIVKEARDLQLYDSITDNGAGGLSCSVAEMAKESGGCIVDLDKVPLKYSGLDPWEIWISESQERMTLALPPKNWKKFLNLMTRRGVKATVIGKFTNGGRCIVKYHGKKIMDIKMNFLHDGWPKKHLKTTYKPIVHPEPEIPWKKDLSELLIKMVKRPNIASFTFISQQYDHIVQGNLVLPPLQGKGRVNAQTVAIRPVLDSKKGVIMSYGLYPSYSDIDTYHMAAASIDTAIRNTVAAGADLDNIYLLDNFCWCDSWDPYRLGQLKRAVRACYDLATFYQTPFISGKDSMFNDFVGFDKDGKPIKISIPPTLLISSLGIIKDIYKVVSLEAKYPGDLVYILGETSEELGGSEYFRMYAEIGGKDNIGNKVPPVDAVKNKKVYQAFNQAVQQELISSSLGIGRGGLGMALAKKAMGAMFGITISLINLPGKVKRNDFALFSESAGRILVTISPKNQKKFERIIKGNSFALAGEVIKKPKIIIRGLDNKIIVNLDLKTAYQAYKDTFKGY